MFHWMAYLYTRYSKSMKTQRDAIKMISKLATETAQRGKKFTKISLGDTHDDNDDNIGYQ